MEHLFYFETMQDFRFQNEVGKQVSEYQRGFMLRLKEDVCINGNKEKRH
jgi:hypothetical protein